MEEESKPADEPLKENRTDFLPIAVVARIIEKCCSYYWKNCKRCKECVQENVSQNLLVSSQGKASERCHQEKRKTINGEDILFAMSTLGFDNYVEPLKLYLQKYRECSKGEKNVSTLPQDASDELSTDDMIAQSLSNSLMSDQNGQQNVIYTTTYAPGQVKLLPENLQIQCHWPIVLKQDE
ncbi:hypothetical protein Btru_014837 [Bulinus truncatus]|nr:hypothetical protein Btru_014837 [Bulinus truncatus]